MAIKKLRLLIGHKNDQFFVQEKSLISKRFEIVSTHYSKEAAEEAIKERQNKAEEYNLMDN